MAELLRNSEHEEQHRRNQRMALSQDTYVYMETVEETENEAAEPNENESAKRLGTKSGNEQTGLLVHNTNSCRKHGNDKRKTDKQRLL